MAKTLGANQPLQPIPFILFSRCHDDGLLEHWIETTSEVVSILIGWAAPCSGRWLRGFRLGRRGL